MSKTLVALSTLIAMIAIPAAQAAPGQSGVADARAAAMAASARLLEELRGVDGAYGVKSARGHDGTELIFAWFKDRDAVLRWYDHSYHRKLLRDAGRPEDGVAAEHLRPDDGPILVIASVAYRDARGSVDASMFDDPAAGKPLQFAVEYYAAMPGGAYMTAPYTPWEAAVKNAHLRDVFDDE